MKVREKKVYYCDFCRKHSLSVSSMSIHEKHCLKNLDRECRLCIHSELTPLTKESRMRVIEKIKSQMSYPENSKGGIPANEIKQPSLKDIIEMLSQEVWDGCPNCFMSVVIATGINNYPYNLDYDYKKELANWWSDINSRNENLI